MAITGAGGPAGAAGATGTGFDTLADSLGELFVCVRDHFERTVQPYDLPLPSAKALRLIEGSISMKELGARIHCDGSFVTAIADNLEERGLARREIDAGDRRIKNLVLTDRGVELRARLLHDLFDDVPGLRNLEPAEREALLVLLRKMLAGEAGSGAGGPGCAA